MMITHGDFEIEVGLAHKLSDGRYTVAWAVYRVPRGAGPVYAGMTMPFMDADTAVALALAEARTVANLTD